MHGNIITDAILNGKAIKLLRDTGARFNTINTNMRIPGETTHCPKVVIAELGVDPTICKGRITKMTIEGHHFGKGIFYTRTMQGVPTDAILGAPFFKTHVIYINFAEKIIGIKPY